MANSKTSTTHRIKLPKVSEYVKNVGKSVGYAAIEGVKASTPGMTDFVKTNNEIFKEVYSGVKNYRKSIADIDRNIKKSNLYRAIDIGVKNLIEDAKTGKFYNDRSADYAEEIAGVDDDYDIDFSTENSSSSTNSNSGAKMISDSVSDAIGAAAISQNSAVAEGTSLVVRANSANTRLIMSQMDKISARFTSGMGSLYTEIGKVNGFLNGPMVTHMENSRRYYEESTKLMRDNSMMLKELLEMQRNIYKSQNSPAKSTNLDNSFTASGMPNLEGYFKNIKSNARNMMDSMGLGLMSSGMGNPLMAFAAAPFQFLMQGLSTKILPKSFRKAVRSLDQGVSGLFPQLIAKLNKARDEEGGILGFLGELFGIQVDKKVKINTANYKKGAVPFDGITRQAIIETIPGYLSRIEAALTGSGERHYDFQSGSWKSAKQIEREFAGERNRSIMNANFGAKQDLNSLINEVGNSIEDDAKRAAVKASLNRNIDKMFERIFEDGGDYNPNMPAAWRYYGFSSPEQFKIVKSKLSKKVIREFAYNNMHARENLSAAIRRNEQNGGQYRHLFNGAYNASGTGGGSKKGPSDFTGGSGLLAMSKDNEGHNIFFYLKKIMEAVQFKGGNKGKINNKKGHSRKSKTSSNTSSDDSSNSGDNADGDPDPDSSGLDWSSYAEERKEEEKEVKRKTIFTDKIKNFLGDTKMAKAIGRVLDGAASILSKPMDYMTKMIEKADKNLFQMMFGEKTDIDGNPYDSVFDYVIDQIKQGFKQVSDYIKKLFDPLKAKLKEWFKPLWDKYGSPVVDELKAMGGKAKDRFKQGIDNTFGKIYRKVVDHKDIQTNAMGGLVTKRGLTMISPGEMIIPASFDKKEQRRMLAEEKKEKNRIIKAIGFNASGTVDIDQMKANLEQIYNENKGKGAKNTAGGIIGAGAGLLTGVNPLLGAMAGAGLSVLSNSQSFQKIVFGDKTIGKKGIIPDNVQEFFKKAAPDMGDFGIAGGILGLLTPFGPLGGAAIGAGIGMLKNSESFKKFIFGDAETGKDGLISKESYDKFKKMVSESVPNMAVGAVGGALLGPFGILGNAVMGAGLGLLSSTDSFHKFIFGYGKNESPDDKEPRKGLLGAVERGIIDPAKEKISEILTNLKDYTKKNIIEPLKNFWGPFKQGIKNVISDVVDGIKDSINDMFEKTIGIPLHDFLQEKIFKPLTKTFFNILKLPINLAKTTLALPMKALGSIGLNTRIKQIHRGRAYDMTAEDRLKFRDEHSFRQGFFAQGFLGRDKMREQDKILSNMSDDDLRVLSEGAASGLGDRRNILQKNLINARRATGETVSAFFNKKDENGKLRYDTAKYKNVKKIVKLAENGDMDQAYALIDKLGLSDAEKAELKKKLEPKATAAHDALERLNLGDDALADFDKEASKLLKRKFTGRKDRKQIYKSAEAELRARAKNKKSTIQEESEETRATNNFAEIYKGKADSIIDLFKQANDKLDHIINPEAAAKDTTPPGDRASEMANKEDVDISKGASNATTSHYSAIVNRNKKASEEAASKTTDPVTGARIDEDSKEFKESEEEEKKRDSINERIANAVEETNENQKGFFGSLLGLGKGKKKKEGGGILDKIGNGVGGFLRFLGVGAGGIASMGLKVIGIGAGVSLLGYASEWFKTSVWPTIKGALFGKENDDGTKTNGLLGGFGNTLHDLFYGKDGEGGILAKAANWIGNKLSDLKNWYTSKGGFSGILINDILPKMITGWGYAVDNIVTPLTAVIFKHLPGLLLGLGKGIFNGLKIAVFGDKKLKRNNNTASMEVDSSDALKEINSMHSSNKSALESAGGDFMNSVKNAYNTAQNGVYSTAKTAISYDFGDMLKNGNDENYEKAGGLSGVLGAKKRTNKVEFDKNGNVITDYSVSNKSDSVLSAVGRGTKNAFVRGLAGDTGAGLLLKGMKGVSTKGTAIGLKGSTRVASKAATGLVKKGIKGAGSVMSGAANAGLAINKGISAAASRPADIAEKVTKYGAKLQSKGMYSAEKISSLQGKMTKKLTEKGLSEGGKEVAEKGIGKGIGKIFSAISKSKIGAKLCAFASKATGKEVTQAIMDKTLGKIADKLSKKATTKLAGKALGKVASAIAGFSPLSIAFMVTDFISGFNNAYTILGVAKGGDYEVSTAQKCACGLLNLLNQRFLLGLIPTETIMDIIIEFLFPLFGLDAESLNKARENAAAVMDAWNAEHADNPDEQYDNLEDFNNKDKWTFKAKKWMGKKLGGAWNATKSAAGKGAELVKKGFNAVADKTKEIVSGAMDIGGFIKTVTTNVIKVATDPEFSWNINDVIKEDDPLGGVKKTIYQVMKVPLGVIGIVSKIGKLVFDKVKGFALNIKDGIKDAWTDISAVAKGQYTVFNKEYWKFNDAEDAENPLGTMSKVVSTMLKVISIPQAMTGWIGSKVIGVFKKLISGAKEGAMDATQDVLNVMKGQYTVFSKNYWASNEQNDDGSNPMSTLGKVFGFVERLVLAPKAMIGWVGSKIVSGFKKLVGGAKEGIIDASSDIAAVAKGQYTVFSSQYWHSDAEEDESNPLSKLGKVFGFVTRLTQAPAAMIGWVGNKVSSWFKNVISQSADGYKDADEDIKNVQSGKYTVFSKDYWAVNKDEEDDNPLTKLGAVSGFITRLVSAPRAMIGYTLTKAKEGFTKLINSAKSVDKETDKIIDKAKDGKISVFSKEYWKALGKENNPLGLIGTISSFIQRLIEAPIVIFTKVFNKIKEKFDSIKGWFKKLFGEDAEDVDTEDNSKKGKGKFGFGRISQLDPSIAAMQYNGHTMAQAGCGPVAATNLINNIKGGNGITLKQAAKYATKHGFKPKNDGTDPRYMSSILSASGIDNEEISGSGNISNSLKHGNPVVIMGKGRTSDSPYGNRSPHYITAMGYDKRGNIVVDDPYERGYKSYKKSDVFNGAMKSVSAKAYGKYGFGMDEALKKKIISKTFEITNGSEGGYDSVVPNDNGSWSVGIAGFHGINIKRLFDAMAEKLSGDAKTKAEKYAGWYNKILSDSEAAEVKSFLNNNAVVSKQVQDAQLEGLVNNNILVPLQMYDNGILKDYRSIILAGDIGNTGPAHLSDWKNNFKPSSGDELSHVKDSLKSSDSWWGRQTGNKYYNGWMNRIERTYNALKTWSADGYTPSINGSGTSVTGVGNSSSTSSTTGSLMTALSNLGTSMVKAMFGTDAYNAIYGNNSNSDSTSTMDTSTIANSSVTSPNAIVEKFVQTALAEEGYKEKASNLNLDDKTANPGAMNYTKYGRYFGNTGPAWPWCAQFVSWAAEKSGVPATAMKRSASCSDIKNFFIDNNRFHSDGSYTPKRGDVVMFQTDGRTSHTGIVTGIKNGKLKTIEGNTSDSVAQRSYNLSDTYIEGYGDLGLGIGTGSSGMDGDSATSKAFGKGGYGKGFSYSYNHTNNLGTGTARNALVKNSNTTRSAPIISGGSSSNAVDYNTFLQTIVTILMNINDNTALLSKVIEILSENFNIKIDKADIDAAHSKSKAQTEKSLNELVRRSSGNTVGVSKLLNNKGTDYIIEAMKALASE